MGLRIEDALSFVDVEPIQGDEHHMLFFFRRTLYQAHL